MAFIESVIIVRKYNGVGIDKFLNGYDMKTGQSLKRRFYNGRIVYVKGKNDLIGLPTLKKQPKISEQLDFYLQF